MFGDYNKGSTYGKLRHGVFSFSPNPLFAYLIGIVFGHLREKFLSLLSMREYKRHRLNDDSRNCEV